MRSIQLLFPLNLRNQIMFSGVRTIEKYLGGSKCIHSINTKSLYD